VTEPLLLRADARTLPLADNSVDLIVTSPPYFGLRSYTDDGEHYAGQLGAEPTPKEFIAALVECTREMVRVLKPSGSIFVNLGDKYSGAQGQTQTGVNGRKHMTNTAATWRQTDPKRTGIPNKSLMLLPERYRIAAVDDLGLVARAVIVWDKPNGLPESVQDRVRRSHEDWVHLTKERRYFADLDQVREPTSRTGMTWEQRRARGDAGRQCEQRGTFGPGMAANPAGRIPGSVWEVPTQPLNVPASLGVDHYAAFPTEWPRRLIRGWCPPGGTVLDPFGGTGTTALVASMLGRTGVSVDLSADYQRIATWRCSDPKERARAAGLDADAVAKIVPPLTGQFDLFGDAS
jgi:DNA modification methylase